MAAYISAAFENTYLPVSGRVRVVVRNLDQGNVPPPPSLTYFPTQPQSLQNFVVAEYLGDTVGERWNRVATLTDISTLTIRRLDVLESLSSNFIAAGVAVGDVINVSIAEPAAWTSAEYPTTNPFQFSVLSVISATQLQISPSFPAFQLGLNWTIPTRGLNKTDGVTRRSGSPVSPATFLDSRFNSYYEDAVGAQNFVIAVQAGMDSLAGSSTLATTLVNQNYTASPI